MMAFLRKLTSSVYIPLGWTLLTVILLCLPGSAFPEDGLEDIPYIDKVIHMILFGGIAVFWSLYFFHKNGAAANWRFTVVTIAICAIALGICMEYVQLNFIPNRAFDRGDILANSLGAVVFGSYFYFRKP